MTRHPLYTPLSADALAVFPRVKLDHLRKCATLSGVRAHADALGLTDDAVHQAVDAISAAYFAPYRLTARIRKMNRLLLVCVLSVLSLHASEAADFIAEWEGYSATPYLCTAHHWTVGYGSRIDLHHGAEDMTQAQHYELLEDRTQQAREDLRAMFPRFDSFTDARQMVLASMHYQIGLSGLCHPITGFKNMVAAINAGDWHAASIAALDSQWARTQTPTRAHHHAQLMKAGE